MSSWSQFWARAARPVSRMFDRWMEYKRTVRYSLLTLNILMLSAIGLFVLRGSTPTGLSGQGILSSRTALASPLDQLSSADIAANASIAAGLAETVAVFNQADSVEAEAAVAAANTTVVAKQQAVATEFKSAADIREYKVQKGDTLARIAAQFDVTSDSIRWSNDMDDSTVEPGQTLLIPPVNGIVYTVKAGDTPDSLAQRYRSNKEQIIAYNDIELTGLKTGKRIIIPDGQPPVQAVFSPLRLSASFGYNGYDYGYCTWYVATKKSVPANLGNASSWAYRARAMGMTVNNTPAAGAAVQTSAYGLGHVAYVEEVLPDGSIWISEMNSRGQRSRTDSTPYGGWGKVNWEHVSASAARSYTYIH